jgi:hypothetical protein
MQIIFHQARRKFTPALERDDIQQQNHAMPRAATGRQRLKEKGPLRWSRPLNIPALN